MRFIAAAVAVCLSLLPLTAATQDLHPASTQLVKAKVKVRKNKVNGRRAPKRAKPHARVN